VCKWHPKAAPGTVTEDLACADDCEQALGADYDGGCRVSDAGEWNCLCKPKDKERQPRKSRIPILLFLISTSNFQSKYKINFGKN